MHTKTLGQYYTLSCLFSAGGTSIISATYVSYLMAHGLSLFETNIVNAAFFAALFICEIPTGAIADLWGRKASFVTACALMSVSMLVYGYSDSFGGFVLAEIIGAVAVTCQSGAFQSWLVDSLKHQGYDGEFSAIFAKENLINKIGTGCAAVAGSYIAACNPSLPWFVGACFAAIAAVIAHIVMKEEYFVHTKYSWIEGWDSLKRITVSSIRYGMNEKAVRFILILQSIQAFAVMAMNMYWQPFFKDKGVNEKHLGFIFVGMIAMLAVGAFIVGRIQSAQNQKSILIRSQILCGLIMIAVICVPGTPLIAVLFMLHEVPRGCWNPLIDGYLHKRIPSSERATIISFCAMIPRIGGTMGLIVSGAVAQSFGIGIAWLMSGIILIVGAGALAKNGSRH